jgi:DNA-binding transcriptional ArsR family regulator
LNLANDFDTFGNMKTTEAVTALASLAQETRLRVFRLLIRKSPGGLNAGEIAQALNVPAPTLSFHLAQLARAGLIECRREGRSLTYSARVKGVHALLQFLTADCCQGRPELCGSGVLDMARGHESGALRYTQETARRD